MLVLAALVLGVAAGAQWWTILLFLHRQSFGVADPQFGRDVGFYVFTLPAAKWAVGCLSAVFTVSIVTTTLLYILPAAAAGGAVGQWLAPIRRGARHLGVLAGTLFVLDAALLAIYAVLLVVLGLAAALLGSGGAEGVSRAVG